MHEIARIMSGRATCRDVLKCLFGLGEFEMTVYKGLVDLGPSRTDDLSIHLKRDKSTVYRALQRLVTTGLVIKQMERLKRGGHYHEYVAISRENVMDRVKECVDEWVRNVTMALETVDIP